MKYWKASAEEKKKDLKHSTFKDFAAEKQIKGLIERH